MRRRFFVTQFTGQSAVMEGDAAHHLGRVLRAQVGQLYELSDGQRVCLGRIENVGRDRVEFALVEELPAYKPTVDVTLLLAVVKFDAFEWAIEKATELGVRSIVPLAAARSEKALVAAAGKRSERWRKILAEAAQQSRRVTVPILTELTTPTQAYASYKDGLRVLLSEHANVLPMRKVLASAKTATAVLAIGPEGGWTDAEVSAAVAAGFEAASLGRLILRTETAVVTALAALDFALGKE